MAEVTNEGDKKLATWRIDAGFASQRQLANKLDIRLQTVGDWETGKAVPSFENAVRLSKVLNVTLDDLAIIFGLDKTNP
jgi:DNA-binding XRE family transcriptional regulator